MAEPQDYNKAIEINASNKLVSLFKEVLKYDQKDFQGAISDYNRAIMLDHNYEEAFYHRGETKVDIKDFLGFRRL